MEIVALLRHMLESQQQKSSWPSKPFAILKLYENAPYLADKSYAWSEAGGTKMGA